MNEKKKITSVIGGDKIVLIVAIAAVFALFTFLNKNFMTVQNMVNYTNPMVMRTFMFEYCDETAFLTLKVRITLSAKIRGSCSFRLHHQAIKVQHQV